MTEEWLRENIIRRPLERKWRIKKREEAGFRRYLIIKALLESKEPLKITEISWRVDIGLPTAHSHLRILRDNGIVCAKIDMSDANRYFAVCPSCPLIKECEERLDFWVKSGLIEAEKEKRKQ